MKTDVNTPREIFYHPRQLYVPLFQRRYVWDKDTQWQPLWEDIIRLVDNDLRGDTVSSHFLGAIVIQQGESDLGSLAKFQVIDGQQRLTTLQLLLAALEQRFRERGFDIPAQQVHDLISNPPAYSQTDEDVYKLWPTRRDQDSFIRAMKGEPRKEHPSLLEVAYEYFHGVVDSWLGEDHEAAHRRANSLASVVQSKLELAVISLDEREDAQAIFETLNGRGTPLSPVDLIKNYVFHTLNLPPERADRIYRDYWAEFETSWWEDTITVGRYKTTRVVQFFLQWLTARTVSEIPLRELFRRFKQFLNTSEEPLVSFLERLHASALRYRSIIERGNQPHGVLSRAELFSYRASALDSEIARPVLIWLFEPERDNVSQQDKDQVLHLLESWLVRRVITGSGSQGHNRVLIDLLRELSKTPDNKYPEVTAEFFVHHPSTAGFWPSDDEVRDALLMRSKKPKHARLRVLFEAVEDYHRGFNDGKNYTMAPVARGEGTIEHLMPQQWERNWSDGIVDEPQRERRDAAINQLGNLTLLSGRLNSAMRNASWGEEARASQGIR